MQDNLGLFCSLYDEKSIETLIKSLFKMSRSKLKSFHLKKNYLKKAVRRKDEIELPLNLINSLMINPKYEGPKVSILTLNKDFIALSKPSMCHSHPLNYSNQDNLLSYLRSDGHYHFLNKFEDKYDRTLVYRLDYETSGVVLLAQEEKRESIKLKFYFAVVHGEFCDSGEILHPITRTGKKIKIDVNEKTVKCYVLPLEYIKEENITLVGVFLNEGRRHQIRVQLSTLGHPIVGDQLYGTDSEKTFFGLHSYCYEVDDKKFIDQNIPFKSLFHYFLNLDSNFQVLCNKFRNR